MHHVAAMRLRLDQLDARGLDLQLGRDDRRVLIGSATDLQGQLVTSPGAFKLELASLARGEIANLQLQLGKTHVSSEEGIVLDDVHGRAHREHERLSLELRAGTASSPQLVLRIGELAIEGRVELAGVRLRIDGKDGVAFAERVVLADVALALGAVRLRIDRIAGLHVAVGWGHDGVRVDAEAIELASGTVELAFPERPAAAPTERTPRRLPFTLDDVLSLLDGVAGDVNVDLALDLTVPVIGRRTATHQFRIPIENGALDYRKLESDLSALEDSLLDFSVRDGGLVLERGIPLIPTRGRGKPIVRWDLEGDDLALAEARRIRLAVLPRFTLVSDGESDPNKPPAVALRQLEARDLDARLQLQLAEPPAALPLRRIDELSVAGNLFHAPSTPPREGHVQARIATLELGSFTIPLGRLQLAIAQLVLDGADTIEVSFAGLSPRRARIALRGLAVTNFRLAPAARPAMTAERVAQPHRDDG